MEVVQKTIETFNVSIPKYLVDSPLVQKFLMYLELQDLVKDNPLTDQQAFELSEEIKEDWWKKNKDWFLKDVKQ